MNKIKERKIATQGKELIIKKRRRKEREDKEYKNKRKTEGISQKSKKGKKFIGKT